MFLADSFQVRDHDQLVVSESPETEILKFLNLTNSATNTAVNINSLR
jgi:polysaccharide export outer membrane protein